MPVPHLPLELRCKIFDLFSLEPQCIAPLQDSIHPHPDSEIVAGRTIFARENDKKRNTLLAGCLASKHTCKAAQRTLFKYVDLGHQINVSTLPRLAYGDPENMPKLDPFLRTVMQNYELAKLVHVLEIPRFQRDVFAFVSRRRDCRTDRHPDTPLTISEGLTAAQAFMRDTAPSSARNTRLGQSLAYGHAAAKIAVALLRCENVQTVVFRTLMPGFQHTLCMAQLPMMRNLRHIEIRTWNESDSESNVPDFTPFLFWLPTLHTLATGPMQCDTADAHFMPRGTSALRILHLEISARCVDVLYTLLSRCPLLEELSVTWRSCGNDYLSDRDRIINYFRPIRYDDIGDVLRTRCPNLARLKIDYRERNDVLRDNGGTFTLGDLSAMKHLSAIIAPCEALLKLPTPETDPDDDDDTAVPTPNPTLASILPPSLTHLALWTLPPKHRSPEEDLEQYAALLNSGRQPQLAALYYADRWETLDGCVKLVWRVVLERCVVHEPRVWKRVAGEAVGMYGLEGEGIGLMLWGL